MCISILFYFYNLNYYTLLNQFYSALLTDKKLILKSAVYNLFKIEFGEK